MTPSRTSRSQKSALRPGPSLDSLFSSSKATTTPSKPDKPVPTSFTLLPPPSQPHQSESSSIARKRRRVAINHDDHHASQISTAPDASHTSTPRCSSKTRPAPRPVGVPRPPTKTRKSRSSELHSTALASSVSPHPEACSTRSSPRPIPKVSPRVRDALASTPWHVIDPDNKFLLASSRLFQLSHLELGPVTRQQNFGKEPKYGGERGGAAGKKRAREVLDQLERDRLTRLGSLAGEPEPASGTKRPSAKSAPEGLELETVPSWAKEKDGKEWEMSILKKLSVRLSRVAAGAPSPSPSLKPPMLSSSSFVPLVWARDLSNEVKQIRLANLECWVIGKEFPCRSVVVVGWILEREWRELDNDRKMWIYTIDDGTGLVQVVCPVTNDEDMGRSDRPESRTSIAPKLDPRLLIPKFYLPSREESKDSIRSSFASDSTRARTTGGGGGRSEARERSYAGLERTSPSSTTFAPDTLVRVVGSITPPANQYQTELRITADVIEQVAPTSEIEHHTLVGRLWDHVYSKEVDVRTMLETIEKEELHERAITARSNSSECTGGELGSSIGSFCPSSVSSKPKKYRPTRPAKLSAEDITLTNFVVYIRYHLVKHHVRSMRRCHGGDDDGASLCVPPPSSQGSSLAPSSPLTSTSQRDGDDQFDPSTEMWQEWCLPFDIDELRRSNKHLELFATRLGIERDRKERERKRAQRKRSKRGGDLALVSEATTGSSIGDGDAVWISGTSNRSGTTASTTASILRGGGGGSARGGMSSRLVQMMLPPPSSHSHIAASSVPRREKRRAGGDMSDDEQEEEEELQGRRLDKETTRCWEDAIRLMSKNGIVVEYVPHDGQDDNCDNEGESDDLDETTFARLATSFGRLPDEPSLSTGSRKTPNKTSSDRYDVERTPRARAEPSANPGDESDKVRHRRGRFQLVTPVSLAPLVLEHVQEISRSLSSSSSERSQRRGRSITELDVRLSLNRDDRWSAVAKYGEVVKRSLEVLENWGEVVASGEGYRLA